MEADRNFDKADINRLVDSLKTDPTDFDQANLSVSDREMLIYSAKLTKKPQTVCRSDIERLRSVGFDDLGIHDIVCCVSYFAFVNRIADGLGIELEQ